jgi:hypothetical protein
MVLPPQPVRSYDSAEPDQSMRPASAFNFAANSSGSALFNPSDCQLTTDHWHTKFQFTGSVYLF